MAITLEKSGILVKDLGKQLENTLKFDDIFRIYKALLLIYPDEAHKIIVKLAKLIKKFKKLKDSSKSPI